MKYLVIAFLALFSLSASAQYINRDNTFTIKGRTVVGRTSEVPASAGAWLEIGDSNTTRGMILPRIGGREVIAVPKVGTFYYDIWTNKVIVRKPWGNIPLLDSLQLAAFAYTDSMARRAVAFMIQNNRGISWDWDSMAATFTPTIKLEDFSTNDLREGDSNLYYTNKRVYKAIKAGPGITIDTTDGTISNTRTGTVTSVGISMPSGFTVTNSPVTTAGSFGITTAFTGIAFSNGSGLQPLNIGTGLALNGSTLSATGGSGSGGFDGSLLAINSSGSIVGGGDLTTTRTLHLENDLSTPGAFRYYGTDSVGNKGWHKLPDSLYSLKPDWNQDSMYKFSLVVDPRILYIDSTSNILSQDTLKVQDWAYNKIKNSISKADADLLYMPIDATFATGDKFFTGDGVADGDRFHDFAHYDLNITGIKSLHFGAQNYFFDSLSESTSDTIVTIEPTTGKLGRHDLSRYATIDYTLANFYPLHENPANYVTSEDVASFTAGDTTRWGQAYLPGYGLKLYDSLAGENTYKVFQLDSSLVNVTGLVTAGTNVTVTGSGTTGSPYVISSTATGTVTGGSITWPGALYNTPTTATVTSGLLNFTPTLAPQAPNTALMGPLSGANAAPAFRRPNVVDISTSAAQGIPYSYNGSLLVTDSLFYNRAASNLVVIGNVPGQVQVAARNFNPTATAGFNASNDVPIAGSFIVAGSSYADLRMQNRTVIGSAGGFSFFPYFTTGLNPPAYADYRFYRGLNGPGNGVASGQPMVSFKMNGHVVIGDTVETEPNNPLAVLQVHKIIADSIVYGAGMLGGGGGGGGTTYTFSNSSIVNTAGNLALSGDATAPGASKVYGTDASGTKGFQTAQTVDMTGFVAGDFVKYDGTKFVRGTASSTTINNNAANSLITGSATANTLNAQSALQFSSTTTGNWLSISGPATGNSNFNPQLQLNDADITTSNFSAFGVGTTTMGFISGASPSGGGSGGLSLNGFTSTSPTAFPLIFSGYHGSTAPTNGAIIFRAGKWNGATTATTLANTEIIAGFRNWTNADAVQILGNGDLKSTGKVTATAINMSTTLTPTSSADATGSVGDVRYDDNFMYIKTSTGWKRSALSTF